MNFILTFVTYMRQKIVVKCFEALSEFANFVPSDVTYPRHGVRFYVVTYILEVLRRIVFICLLLCIGVLLSSAIMPDGLSDNRVPVVVIAVLLIMLCSALSASVLLYRRCSAANDRLKEANDTIRDANATREIAIGNLLSFCSLYMDKYEEQNRFARLKLHTGKAEELHTLIKSGKFRDEHFKVFNEFFDVSFLRLFPSFVDDVNTLLQPDQQLALPVDGRLSTETRILALFRMGMSDTSEVAKLTGASINTIYTYRNRTRGRAIDRSSFEKQVMNLCLPGEPAG